MTINSVYPEVFQLHNLLKEYSFDVEAHATEVVLEGWLQEFDWIWISHAITEALYQGRYKLVSVEQILRLWQRRGHPIRHFNREFETIILGQALLCYPDTSEPEEAQTLLPQAKHAEQPPSMETSPQQNYPAVGGLSLGLTNQAVEISEEPHLFPTPTAPRQNAPSSPTDDLASWFQSTMPVPEFQAIRGTSSAEMPQPEPIRPFVPKQEVSAMHQRLKAVVRAGARQP